MTNKRIYPRDMSFIDRQGNLVRPDKRGYIYSKHDILNRLRKKLKVSNSWQRKKILEGVYKQLVVSTTGKTAKGEYRDFVEKKDDMTQYLARYVSRELEDNGLENQSRRLRKQYGVGIGKAYAFFDCQAPKEEIEKELLYIRDAVETPGDLELSLMEDFSQIGGDSEIVSIAKIAKEAGLRYTMEASYPHATNRQTVDELNAILVQAGQSPLYPQGEKFRRHIVYKDLGRYVERE